MSSNGSLVSIVRAARAEYPVTAPFSPAQAYPEYRGQDLSAEGWVYDAVRETLHLQGLDTEHFGTPDWNPFCDLVKPGNRVVIKPNLVIDYNQSGGGLECVITHASVLRPIIDYVLIALQESGKIVIADSPHGNTNFENILTATRLRDLLPFYTNNPVTIEVRDVRQYEYGFGPAGFVSKRKTVNRDPEGYVEINLGSDSAVADIPNIHLLYGADFDRREIRRYHNRTANKYLIAKTFLTADVIINVPKLKTHKKIGATLNIKSLIGINGDKNYLPHYRIGDPRHGGDEFPNTQRLIEWWIRRGRRWLFDTFLGDNTSKKIFLYRLLNLPYAQLENFVFRGRTHIGSGDWYGNETVYRTCYDLVKILFHADRDGNLHLKPQRRFFSVLDGVVAGEKNGPLAPSPKYAGVLITGESAVAVDLVGTRLMGFDVEKMIVFRELKKLPSTHPLQPIEPKDIQINTHEKAWGRLFDHRDRLLVFTPHPGWAGSLEIQ